MRTEPRVAKFLERTTSDGVAGDYLDEEEAGHVPLASADPEVLEQAVRTGYAL